MKKRSDEGKASRRISSVEVVCGPNADFLRTGIMASRADNQPDNHQVVSESSSPVRPVEA